MDLSVTVPEEPEDRSVVVDPDRVAWQRRDDLATAEQPERRWFRTGLTVTLFGFEPGGVKTWPHLVVDKGSLTLLAPVAASEPGERLTRAEPDPEPVDLLRNFRRPIVDNPQA